MRLLVGSNSPIARAGLRAVLESSGDFDIMGETSLGNLAPLALELRPDVVVIEIGHRDQAALDAIWSLVSSWPEASVLALSGDPGEDFASECIEAGARGFLLRDVSSEELQTAVRAVHQGLTVLHPGTARALLPQPKHPEPPRESEPLTERESEVLQLVAQGLPSKSIAARLSISEHTVKFHIGSILGKLGAASRTEAVTSALRRGLISV